jgi:hypothetical protein
MPLAGIIVYSIVLSTTMPRLNASALTLISGILLLSACASGPPTGEVMELPVFPPAPEEARFYYERSLISTADVEIESGEARLERMLTGVTRTGIGMSKPFAVSVHQGRVFVSDTVQRMVWAFDVRAGKFFEIGVDGGGVLAKPMGLDVDLNGNLFVCDNSLKQVLVYDRDGNYKRRGRHRRSSQPAPPGAGVRCQQWRAVIHHCQARPGRGGIEFAARRDNWR